MSFSKRVESFDRSLALPSTLDGIAGTFSVVVDAEMDVKKLSNPGDIRHISGVSVPGQRAVLTP